MLPACLVAVVARSLHGRAPSRPDGQARGSASAWRRTTALTLALIVMSVPLQAAGGTSPVLTSLGATDDNGRPIGVAGGGECYRLQAPPGRTFRAITWGIRGAIADQTFTEEEGRTTSFPCPRIVHFPGGATESIAEFFYGRDETSVRVTALYTDGTAAKAGDRLEVGLPLRKAVRVEGVVRERGSGAPIAGARVSVSTPSTPGRGYPIRADDRGRYAFYSLPGKASVDVTEMPPAYIPSPGLSLREVEIPAGVERHELPPIEPARGVAVRGVVVDEAGHPVEGAAISGNWGMTEAGASLSAVIGATSGRDGTFRLEGIHPGAAVTQLSARRRSLATAAHATAKAGQAEPVTLRVSEARTVALAGRVVDPAGRPVPDALVVVWHKTPHGDGSGSYGGPVSFDEMPEIRTAADGTFRTPKELRRDIEYHAEVTASGMLPGRTGRIRIGETGEARFSDLVLGRRRRQRALSGRVLNRRGAAVAGAEITSSGDGPGRARVETDAEGRFRLEGVAGESVLVFAQVEGFRPGGRVVAADVEEADLKLDRSGEAPMEAGPLPPPPTTRDEDKAVVTRLLAPLRRGGDGRPPSPYSSDILAAMARARPEEVIDLVQQQIVAVDDRLAAEIALGLYESDRDAALAAIESVRGNYTASRAAMDAFDARPDADPSWRRSLLELALKRAREEADPSRRAWLLGWVADRLFLMGATDRATAVVREAEALVADRPRGAFLHPRDAVAAPLARIDPKAALDLIGPARDGTSNDRSIYSGAFAAVAERVAATRPDEAERLFALVTEDGYRERSLPALCARMARVDLPRARCMAGSAKGPARQAAALGAAARALAKSDPEAARALLADAFARLAAPPEGRSNLSQQRAWLLPVAERIDPRVVPEFLWRTLRDRPSDPPEPSADGLAASATIAALIAPYDRKAAEVVFTPVAERWPALVAASDRGLDDRLQGAISAAAAYDPRVASALVESLPEDKPGRDRPKDAARVAAARMIALPPSQRLRELARRSFILPPEE